MYDAIIIGSGVGGLAAASVLAQAGKTVLVIEKHFVAGGQTHEFKRQGKFSWDVGLHYVGDLNPSQPERHFFDYISQYELDWVKQKGVFDTYLYPKHKIETSEKDEHSLDYLINSFPEEKKAIIKYYKDIVKIKRTFIINKVVDIIPIMPALFLRIFNSFNKNASNQTLDTYLNKHFKSEELKGILSSTWLAYMMPPKDASIVIDSIVKVHYQHGSFYPKGGSALIAKTISSVINNNKGRIILATEVSEIITKNGKAIGVEVCNRKNEKSTFYAKNIISNAGYVNTLKLLKNINKSFYDKLKLEHSNYSSLNLFLGLKAPPSSIGFTTSNYAIFNDYDHNLIFENSSSILDGKPNHCFISFPSLKKEDSVNHTAHVLCNISYNAFKEWENSEWMKRGDDYINLKEKISNSLIDFINDKFPGFKDLVIYKELSTPLTIENLTNWPQGNYNGVPSNTHRYNKFKGKLPVKNLWLSGTDANAAGVVGAMMGGVFVACRIKSCFYFSVLAIKGYLKYMKKK